MIVVRRERGATRDIFRRYQVMIDGEMAAKVKRGRTVTLPVPPGSHEIFVRIDWCRSSSVEVNVRPGDVIEMSCEPAGPAAEGLRSVVGKAAASYIGLSRL